MSRPPHWRSRFAGGAFAASLAGMAGVVAGASVAAVSAQSTNPRTEAGSPPVGFSVETHGYLSGQRTAVTSPIGGTSPASAASTAAPPTDA